ncbi:hypothetical protein ABV23_RS02350 [Escherichia coli]|nr:Ig-like domain-containing protein [Escherichia coli]
MKPIAGLDQFPFVIGGLQVTAAKIEGQVFVKELYVIKQRTFDSYDLISENFKIYKDIKITGRNKDKSTLTYDDDDAEIAKSLANNTFCIKESDDFNKKYGFGIQYQLNKIKLHNGEVIFRQSSIRPSVLNGVFITPSSFEIDVGQQQVFDAIYDPQSWINKNGTWDYDKSVFDVVSFTQTSITLLAKQDAINTEIKYSPTGREINRIAVSIGSVVDNTSIIKNISITPNVINSKLSEDFTVNVVYDPIKYKFKSGKWSVSDTSVLQFVSGDGETATFKPISVGSSTITFTLDKDSTKTATASVEVSYADLKSVTISPENVTGTIGETGSISISYVPDNAQKGGSWAISDKLILKELSSTISEFDYELVGNGTTYATFVPLANYDGSMITAKFDVNYSKLENIVLTPSSVSNLVPGDTGKISIEYTPSTVETGGTWSFNPTGVIEQDLSKSTSTEMYYNVLIPGTSTATFHPTASYDGTPKTVSFEVGNSELTGITLTPTTSTVKIGDDFYIDITYEPNTALHEGTWNTSDFEKYVTLESDSTPDRAHFKAIGVIDSVNLTYSKGTISATNKCAVNYSDLKSITLSPTATYAKLGDDFYVDIAYDPDTAQHTGSWNTSDFEKYVTLESDSTPDRAHFKAIDLVDEVDLVYSNGNISDTNYCGVSRPPLISVSLSPSSEKVKVGDSFNVKITYNPNTAQHYGEWNLDEIKEYLTYDSDLSVYDVAVFDVIKRSETPIELKFTSAGKTATNTCEFEEAVLTGISLKIQENTPIYDSLYVVPYKGDIYIDVLPIPADAKLPDDIGTITDNTGLYDLTFFDFLSFNKEKSTNHRLYFDFVSSFDEYMYFIEESSKGLIFTYTLSNGMTVDSPAMVTNFPELTKVTLVPSSGKCDVNSIIKCEATLDNGMSTYYINPLSTYTSEHEDYLVIEDRTSFQPFDEFLEPIEIVGKLPTNIYVPDGNYVYFTYTLSTTPAQPLIDYNIYIYDSNECIKGRIKNPTDVVNIKYMNVFFFDIENNPPNALYRGKMEGGIPVTFQYDTQNSRLNSYTYMVQGVTDGPITLKYTSSATGVIRTAQVDVTGPMTDDSNKTDEGGDGDLLK